MNKKLKMLLLGAMVSALPAGSAFADSIAISANPTSIIADGTSGSDVTVNVEVTSISTSTISVYLMTSGPGSLNVPYLQLALDGSHRGSGVARFTSSTTPGSAGVTARMYVGGGNFITAVTTITATPLDSDGDGIPNSSDNCPTVANANQLDVDHDGIGDACDPLVDSDGDGIADSVDNCPAVSNANQRDNDGDNYGNVCDRFPNNPKKH